jgi:hypothetical protein
MLPDIAGYHILKNISKLFKELELSAQNIA